MRPIVVKGAPASAGTTTTATGSPNAAQQTANPLAKASLPPRTGASIPPLQVSQAPASAGGTPSNTPSSPSSKVEYFKNVGPNFDLDEWIKMSGLRDAPEGSMEELICKEDLQKIKKLGIWEDKYNVGGEGASFIDGMVNATPLKAFRGLMGAAWLGTGFAIACCAVTAPVSLVFYAPLILPVNWVIQRTLGGLYTQKFEGVFSEIKREMKDAGSLQAGIAWVGVMYKFLEDQNPIWLFSDQTKLWNFKDSKSITAVKRQLIQAARYAANTLEDNKDPGKVFFKDKMFDKMLSQNDESLEKFENRCMGFLNGPTPYANPLRLLKKLWYGK